MVTKRPNIFTSFQLQVSLSLGDRFITTIHERVKVDESQHKQCRVTTHFFAGQNVLKKYWVKKILTWSIEESFSRDLLTTYEGIYLDSLILIKKIWRIYDNKVFQEFTVALVLEFWLNTLINLKFLIFSKNCVASLR